jgi:hypothetical protein
MVAQRNDRYSLVALQSENLSIARQVANYSVHYLLVNYDINGVSTSLGNVLGDLWQAVLDSFDDCIPISFGFRQRLDYISILSSVSTSLGMFFVTFGSLFLKAAIAATLFIMFFFCLFKEFLMIRIIMKRPGSAPPVLTHQQTDIIRII